MSQIQVIKFGIFLSVCPLFSMMMTTMIMMVISRQSVLKKGKLHQDAQLNRIK